MHRFRQVHFIGNEVNDLADRLLFAIEENSQDSRPELIVSGRLGGDQGKLLCAG